MPSRKKEKKIQVKNKKTCFLITPIGSTGDEVRRRVDQWMECIYKPAIGKEYRITRADEYQVPGVITEQIVQLIVDADLVIIDYTGLNRNVMYEAAIRHLAEKPFIQIYKVGEDLPFDIHNLRSIPYDSDDLNYPKNLVNQIKNNLKAVLSRNYEQPKLVREKFDFNRIISDPEKFISVLKKFINIPDSENNKGIISIDSPYYSSARSMYSSILGMEKIVCPKCGTVKFKDNNAWSTVSINFGSLSNKTLYKCTNCGTEFEA